MRDKETVAKQYLNSLPKQYKILSPENAQIVITGAGKHGSIGEHIVQTLKNDMGTGTIRINNNDVRQQLLVDEMFVSTDTHLIMCHGATNLDWIEKSDWVASAHVVDVNLNGTINCVRAFVNATMQTEYRKTIIGIGSMAYRHILNGSSVYCASKAGMAHFMKCIAWELAPKGYDVYTIHPSNVDGTPMAKQTIEELARYRGLTQEEAQAYWGANYLRGRSLSRQEISALVLQLVLLPNEFLSGQQFELTGGQR